MMKALRGWAQSYVPANPARHMQLGQNQHKIDMKNNAHLLFGFPTGLNWGSGPTSLLDKTTLPTDQDRDKLSNENAGQKHTGNTAAEDKIEKRLVNGWSCYISFLTS